MSPVSWVDQEGGISSAPVWRSLLYVPAHVEKYISLAHKRGADAIILDLEDAVPQGQKAAAREHISISANRVAQGGADVLVRINRPLAMAVRDVEAAIGPGVRALSLPKVESAAHVQLLDEMVTEVECSRGLPKGHTGFLVLIESALGLSAMREIGGASPRIVGMTIGGEDLALDIGMESNDETLLLPKQLMIQACAVTKIMPFGIVGSLAKFDDEEAYLVLARRSRQFGFVGSSCIHPRQVQLLNQAFTPTEEEVAYAASVVEKAAQAEREGKGAFALNGKMIDAPIVGRARRLLAQQAAINARLQARRVDDSH